MPDGRHLNKWLDPNSVNIELTITLIAHFEIAWVGSLIRLICIVITVLEFNNNGAVTSAR